MSILDVKEKLEEANARSRDFAQNMSAFRDRLLAAHKANKSLRAALKEVEPQLLELLGTSMLTIYQSIDNGKEIKAVFKGGLGSQPADVAAGRTGPFPHDVGRSSPSRHEPGGGRASPGR